MFNEILPNFHWSRVEMWHGDFSSADMQMLISPAGWAVSMPVGGGVLFLMRPSRH
jgi:hypothetical protein